MEITNTDLSALEERLKNNREENSAIRVEVCRFLAEKKRELGNSKFFSIVALDATNPVKSIDAARSGYSTDLLLSEAKKLL